jgi:hypothetical protein
LNPIAAFDTPNKIIVNEGIDVGRKTTMINIIAGIKVHKEL